MCRCTTATLTNHITLHHNGIVCFCTFFSRSFIYFVQKECDVRCSSQPTTIKLISTFSHFFANLFGRVYVCVHVRARCLVSCLLLMQKRKGVKKKPRPNRLWILCLVSTICACIFHTTLRYPVLYRRWNRWMCSVKCWKKELIESARQSEPFSMHCFPSWALFFSPSLASHMQSKAKQ